MRIDVFSDTICPWCYVGKKRLEAALAERPDIKAEVVWHPFELNPDMADEGMDRADYLATKFGSAEKSEEIYASVRAAGDSVGIPFVFGPRVPNTARSHTLIFWAQQENVGPAVVEALFQAYFLDGADIGDIDVLADIAETCGMDRDVIYDRLLRGEDLDGVKAVSERCREMGMNGVPCFIIERKYALVGAQPNAVFLDLFDQIASGELG